MFGSRKLDFDSNFGKDEYLYSRINVITSNSTESRGKPLSNIHFPEPVKHLVKQSSSGVEPFHISLMNV